MGSEDCRLCRRRPLAPVAEEVTAGWRGAYGAVVNPACYPKLAEDEVSLRPSFCTWADGSPMHFFAVFDGHGGPQVSALCRDRMHAILADELARAAVAYRKEHPVKDEEAEVRAWKAALTRSFVRADALWVTGGVPSPSATVVGSTALVALLVRGRILVANCGDSRAVLCRGGRAIPLSRGRDHKLERPDKVAQFTAAGGGHEGSVLRLHVSRALGHSGLKPEVTCDPEITLTARSKEDDCLILASYGLWGVISNQLACDAARKYLEDKSNDTSTPVGKEEEDRCVHAACRLTNLAIHKHSKEDISVVVLDLKVSD